MTCRILNNGSRFSETQLCRLVPSKRGSAWPLEALYFTNRSCALIEIEVARVKVLRLMKCVVSTGLLRDRAL